MDSKKSASSIERFNFEPFNSRGTIFRPRDYSPQADLNRKMFKSASRKSLSNIEKTHTLTYTMGFEYKTIGKMADFNAATAAAPAARTD